MNWTLLLYAIAVVESGDDTSAINEREKAVGHLQIRPCVVMDVNRIYGTSFLHREACLSNRQVSEDICRRYLVYWAAQHEGSTGQHGGYEVCARIWNGGPRGPSKKSTERYWQKVKKVIEQELERELAAE